MPYGAGTLGWLWLLAGLGLIAGIALIVVWAVQRGARGSGDEALRTLEVRLARGELDATQYAEARRELGASQPAPSRNPLGLIGLIFVVAAILVLIAGSWLGPVGPGWGGGMGPGMMGGAWTADQPGPGAPGFVAGTPCAPRVVHILAGPGYTFSPSEVRIAPGETITFVVTTMGPYVHEFKVGPAAEVAADSDAAPEIADIGMMQTKSLTYTFSDPGPFAFACHEPGHYEAGMRGVITVVS